MLHCTTLYCILSHCSTLYLYQLPSETVLGCVALYLNLYCIVWLCIGFVLYCSIFEFVLPFETVSHCTAPYRILSHTAALRICIDCRLRPSCTVSLCIWFCIALYRSVFGFVPHCMALYCVFRIAALCICVDCCLRPSCIVSLCIWFCIALYGPLLCSVSHCSTLYLYCPPSETVLHRTALYCMLSCIAALCICVDRCLRPSSIVSLCVWFCIALYDPVMCVVSHCSALYLC